MGNKPYRPSNGTEGAWFEDRFCSNCTKDKFDEGGDSCEILGNAFCFSIDEEGYPSEWIYDDQGEPTCTALSTEDIPGQTESQNI
jgi:hypothetical protein